MHRVLVVPWSMAATYCGIAVPLVRCGQRDTRRTARRRAVLAREVAHRRSAGGSRTTVVVRHRRTAGQGAPQAMLSCTARSHFGYSALNAQARSGEGLHWAARYQLRRSDSTSDHTPTASPAA